MSETRAPQRRREVRVLCPRGVHTVGRAYPTPLGVEVAYTAPLRVDATGREGDDIEGTPAVWREGDAPVGSEAFCGPCGKRTYIDLDQIAQTLRSGGPVYRLTGKRQYRADS